MGCGGTKEVETKHKVLLTKHKQKASMPPPVACLLSSPIRKNIYGEGNVTTGRISTTTGHGGVETSEPGALSRACQIQFAVMTASVVDTYKDVKFGKGDEQTDGDDKLSVEKEKKLRLWLQGLPEVPVPITDLILDDRPGTPEGYYRKPKPHVKSSVVTYANNNKQQQKQQQQQEVTYAPSIPEGNDADEVTPFRKTGSICSTVFGDPEEVLDLSEGQMDGTDTTVPLRLYSTAILNVYMIQLVAPAT